MAAPDPPIGLRHAQTLVVEPGLTVPEVSPAFSSFRDMPPVFATAYMVGFVEATCIAALKPYVADHQRTVGTHIDMSHSAATPVGMSVTVEVELVAVKGRSLRFRVECRDEVELVGAGFHERVVIDFAKFVERGRAKAGERSS